MSKMAKIGDRNPFPSKQGWQITGALPMIMYNHDYN